MNYANDRGAQSRRTTVLLGTGASANAGLPVTSELAARILKRANDSMFIPPWVRILNAVYGAMAGHQGLRGNDPQTAVNIETLISSLRLLQIREDHEVAPFVTTWLPALTELPIATPNGPAAKHLVEAILEYNDTTKPDYLAARISKAVGTLARSELKPDMAAPLRDAEKFVLNELTNILGAQGDVSYLGPLVSLAMNQPGGADVITLNYDLTVERVTDGIIEVNRGVHSWRPGESIHFPTRDRSMNLIKVHGSLDWVVRKTPAPHGLVVSTEIVEADRNAYSSGDASAPWIVVGDRDKLGTDGPTIELNYAAREALRRTDHLAVVGYSFRDEHINTLIRDWMAGDETRTMTVLDKKWPTFSRNSRHDPADFRSQLVATYAPRVDNEGERIQSRLLPVEGTADEKLLEVLKSEPTADPKELITIEQLPEGRNEKLLVTWHGPRLDVTQVEVKPIEQYAGPRGMNRATLSSPEATLGTTSQRSQPRSIIRFFSWGCEETKTIFLNRGPHDEVALTISGPSILGGYTASVVLADYDLI